MPSDRLREASRMLRIAQRDLKTVQQATEKDLKAWISALEQQYRRTQLNHVASLLP